MLAQMVPLEVEISQPNEKAYVAQWSPGGKESQCLPSSFRDPVQGEPLHHRTWQLCSKDLQCSSPGMTWGCKCNAGPLQARSALWLFRNTKIAGDFRGMWSSASWSSTSYIIPVKSCQLVCPCSCLSQWNFLSHIKAKPQPWYPTILIA